jgi:hypothetical protein
VEAPLLLTSQQKQSTCSLLAAAVGALQVEVHTPATVRAQELQQLYRGLNLTQLTVDERLDVLLHVKWTVKEFDCGLTRELVELIDREADLVNR